VYKLWKVHPPVVATDVEISSGEEEIDLSSSFSELDINTGMLCVFFFFGLLTVILRQTTTAHTKGAIHQTGFSIYRNDPLVARIDRSTVQEDET